MSLTQTGWAVRCDHPDCGESTPPQATAALARLAWFQLGGGTQLRGLWPVEGRAEPVALPELYTCAGHTPAWDAPRPAWMARAGR